MSRARTPEQRARRVAYNKAWYQKNKDKKNAQVKNWQKRNPAKVKEQCWRRTGINITFDVFQRLLSEQSNGCAICRIPIGRSAHVDHDHTTGLVRGLLCSNCNQGLGHFKDSTLILEAAVQYVANHIERNYV